MKNNIKLDARDFKKINDFVYETNNFFFKDNYNFRSKIIRLLNSIFKYDKIAFVIFDKETNIYDPNKAILNNEYLNIDYEITQEFCDYFYEIDISNPSNFSSDLRKKIKTRTVFDLSDIISEEEYELSHFYKNFMKKHDLYYFIKLFLKFDDRFLGYIKIFRSKNESNFNQRDRLILTELGKHISLGLYNSLNIENLLNERYAVENYLKKFPVGVIVLDNNYNCINSNDLAKEYAEELEINSIKHFKNFFTQKILPEIRLNLYNKNPTKPITVNNFVFKVVPYDRPDLTRLKIYYNIFVMKLPSDLIMKRKKLGRKYNLTTREKEVVSLIIKGYTNKKIGEELFISLSTVKTHISNIYTKTKVNCRIDLLKKIENI